MRLTDLARVVPLDVVSDGDFSSIGLLSSSDPRLLACLYDSAYRRLVASHTTLACVITTPALASALPDHVGVATAGAPRARFLDVIQHLGASTDFFGADAPSVISPEARVDSRAFIAPLNVSIAEGCVIEAGASVLDRTTLDASVVVRTGAAIGASGFHPVTYADGLRNMPHYGAVRLGRGVEIGANAVVCRAAFSRPTAIGPGTIVGPLAYVAHAVTIGADCRIAAGARVAGSAAIGARVFIGPGATIANDVRVGDDARVSLGAIVVRDVPAGQTVSGHFAVEHGRFLTAWRRLMRRQ
jgi:UDP-3-O-[3-hydroxymyristoyl] glucosamine N-acyltransferase